VSAPPATRASTKRVAVIGAGSGGICAARHMLAEGFDVTIYESGSHVGGLWVYENDNGQAQAYKHLCIISTRRDTAFDDFDFDADTPRFPSHWDMARYLRQYADHFGVTERIQFNSRVELVEPRFDPHREAPRWMVRLVDGTSDEYDAVLVATGHLHEPRHVESFRSRFAGEYRHSRDYRVPDAHVGKRVCVVGTGNSGVDIASDVCTVAERTVLVARSGVRIQPKVVFGVAYPALAIGLRRHKWIPAKVRNKILTGLMYLAHGNQDRLGFERPTARQHPTSSETIVAHIEFNRVAVKPDILAIDGTRLTFTDGTSEEFDVLFAATGYKVHLPFLAPEVAKVEGNHIDLYKRMFSVDWPGLCFIGMLNPLTAYSRIFEGQSRLLRDYVAGRIALPSRDDMLADIDAKRERAEAIYAQAPRHELEEPDVGYFEELDALRVDGGLRILRGPLARRVSHPLVKRAYWRLLGRRRIARIDRPIATA
jgi:dimethylaniline monooxygenase (N-oxide forming)